MTDRGPKDHLTPRHYAAQDIHGPLKFFNPTKRHIPLPRRDAKSAATVGEKTVPDGHGGAATEAVTADEPYHIWRSRDNRKGRHAVAVKPEHVGKSGVRPTSTLVETMKGLGKMFVRYPVWDVSYDVAMIYTIGKSRENYGLFTPQSTTTPRVRDEVGTRPQCQTDY